MPMLYETDPYSWALKQADALRRRSGNEIDWDNVAEEIEAVGKSQESELRNRLAVLLAHLLKWRFQPERRGASWANTIRTQRGAIADHVADNPGLKSKQDHVFGRAYLLARGEAANEMECALDALPPTTPFTLEEALDEAFWPNADGE
jgi:hypothetical protein